MDRVADLATHPGSPRRVRVLVAAPDRKVCARLRRWLEHRGPFEVVEEVTDGVQAVAAAGRARPDLAVIDLALPRLHGLQATSEIRRLLPQTRIVVRSVFSVERVAQAAIEAGADAYVEKTAGKGALLDVLEELTSSSSLRSPPVDENASGVVWPSETMELLEALVVASPVGAVLLDSDTRLVIANPVADRLLGGTAFMEPAPGSRRLCWADTMEQVEAEDLPVRSACQGKAFDDLELYVEGEQRSGGGAYVRISGRPVTGPRGVSAGAVFAVLDVTAAKESELALARSHEELRRANDELASFASTVSHDLSQPLQKIQGYAQLLQEGGVQDPHAGEYVDKIVAASHRMRALIQDLLSYSRVTSDDRPFERVALGPVVAEAVELFEQEIAASGARVEVGPLPTVVADVSQMGQLFQNLIGNALTYVHIGVVPVVEVTSSRLDGAWQVTVADNGIGISPGDRERAFAMFERLDTPREYSGTGVGLAVCARIVERHDGRIWIEDNPGEAHVSASRCPRGPSRGRAVDPETRRGGQSDPGSSEPGKPAARKGSSSASSRSLTTIGDQASPP